MEIMNIISISRDFFVVEILHYAQINNASINILMIKLYLTNII